MPISVPTRPRPPFDTAYAVIGEAFYHLHAATNPEDVAQAANRRPDSELLDVFYRCGMVVSVRHGHKRSLVLVVI